MKIQWEDAKIQSKDDKAKLKKVKREAVFLNGIYVCPLCFEGNFKVIKAQTADAQDPGLLKFSARCNKCNITITYLKKKF